ncbi:hypothetical protein ABPG77_001122 [Micractinium sp. CCAP 211/92]
MHGRACQAACLQNVGPPLHVCVACTATPTDETLGCEACRPPAWRALPLLLVARPAACLTTTPTTNNLPFLPAVLSASLPRKPINFVKQAAANATSLESFCRTCPRVLPPLLPRSCCCTQHAA